MKGYKLYYQHPLDNKAELYVYKDNESTLFEFDCLTITGSGSNTGNISIMNDWENVSASTLSTVADFWESARAKAVSIEFESGISGLIGATAFKAIEKIPVKGGEIATKLKNMVGDVRGVFQTKLLTLDNIQHLYNGTGVEFTDLETVTGYLFNFSEEQNKTFKDRLGKILERVMGIDQNFGDTFYYLAAQIAPNDYQLEADKALSGKSVTVEGNDKSLRRPIQGTLFVRDLSSKKDYYNLLPESVNITYPKFWYNDCPLYIKLEINLKQTGKVNSNQLRKVLGVNEIKPRVY